MKKTIRKTRNVTNTKRKLVKKNKAKALKNRKKRSLEPIRNQKELKKLLKRIKISHRDSALILLRIYMTKDWAQLGCTSFKDFVEKSLPHESYEAVLSRATSDEVAFELEGEQAVGKYSMNAMRAIKGFKGGSRRDLWQALKAEAELSPKRKLTPHWLTASRVEEVINSLLVGDEDDTEQVRSNFDSLATGQHESFGEQHVSAVDEVDYQPPVIPVEKPTLRESTISQKDKPKSEIEINKAEEKTVSRSTRSEELQTILEEYDGSRPLSKVISQFAVKNFGVNTLRRMKKELTKGICKKNQSESNTHEAKS